MSGRIPKSKLLRFPVLFGGLLVMGSFGFVYRQSFMQDIEEKRKNLYKEDLEGRRHIEEFQKKF